MLRSRYKIFYLQKPLQNSSDGDIQELWETQVIFPLFPFTFFYLLFFNLVSSNLRFYFFFLPLLYSFNFFYFSIYHLYNI